MVQLPAEHPRCAVGIEVSHAFSYEIDRLKQNWIRRNLGVKLLFEDATAMGRPAAFDVISQAYQVVPSCMCVVAGTSCVDLSGQKLSDKCGALTSGDGSSTLTFLGLLAYCTRHRPRLVLVLISS